MREAVSRIYELAGYRARPLTTAEKAEEAPERGVRGG